MLATDGCASNSSKPGVLLLRHSSGGPRGVAVAMFGPSGLDMLICRIEGVALLDAYAQHCMIICDSVHTVAFTELPA